MCRHIQSVNMKNSRCARNFEGKEIARKYFQWNIDLDGKCYPAKTQYTFARFCKVSKIICSDINLERRHSQVWAHNGFFCWWEINSTIVPNGTDCFKYFFLTKARKSHSQHIVGKILLICNLLIFFFISLLQSWIKILLRDFRPVWLMKAIFINGKF